jgi:hypothetical protein
LNPACGKAQELLAQLDEAQSPRASRVAARTAAAQTQAAKPMTSEERHEKYPLPPGWARVPEKTNAQGNASPAPKAPATPASGTISQGTVTFE